jgi:dTDP-4-dehydrorhamnose reductase
MPAFSTVWVTGAGGLIGHYLVETAPRWAPGARVVGLTRERLDLADFPAVRKAFETERPGLVIHCAALSRSPDCQANPSLARKLNVEVTSVLAGLSGDIPFIFFSSDLVFDGRAAPYKEDAAVNPLSVYAETKVEAEQVVMRNMKHTVIRTSLNGGVSPTRDRGFNEQMRHAWQRGQTIKLFTDEFRCPIPAEETARAVWELAARGATGIFHVAGAQRLSRWQLGQLMARRWRALEPRMEAASLTQYAGAPRSPDTSLLIGKAQALLSAPLPGLTEWLETHPDREF